MCHIVVNNSSYEAARRWFELLRTDWPRRPLMSRSRLAGRRDYPISGGHFFYLPTKFSSTELFPALWPPTTAICGRSKLQAWPMVLKASCSLLTSGINSSMPRFPMVPYGTEGLGISEWTERRKEGGTVDGWMEGL